MAIPTIMSPHFSIHTLSSEFDLTVPCRRSPRSAVVGQFQPVMAPRPRARSGIGVAREIAGPVAHGLSPDSI
jgi:hypothetical protein